MFIVYVCGYNCSMTDDSINYKYNISIILERIGIAEYKSPWPEMQIVQF